MFERVIFFMGRLSDGTRKEHNMLLLSPLSVSICRCADLAGRVLVIFHVSWVARLCFLNYPALRVAANTRAAAPLYATAVIVAGQLNTTDSYQIMILCFDEWKKRPHWRCARNVVAVNVLCVFFSFLFSFFFHSAISIRRLLSVGLTGNSSILFERLLRLSLPFQTTAKLGEKERERKNKINWTNVNSATYYIIFFLLAAPCVR